MSVDSRHDSVKGSAAPYGSGGSDERENAINRKRPQRDKRTAQGARAGGSDT